MQDRYFFPLAAVVAGAFVLTALQPYMPRPPRGPLSCGGCANIEDVTAAGKELHRFVPGNFDGVSMVETPEGPILRITRLAEQVYEDPRSGPHIVLAEDLEFAFESRLIEVTIEARATPDAGASQFEADYFAKSEGESGWQPFDLTSDWKPYSFSFETPASGGTLGYDYLAIRPVVPDKRRAMDVRSIRIRALGPKPASPAIQPG
jgi:hypothetical protein